jgi:nucleoid-associated protein YgaU
MGLLSSIFGKNDKKDKPREAAAKPSFGNVSSGASSTAREAPKPTAPVPEPAAPAPAGTVYEIQKGDTLSAIAQRHYGNANAWHKIYEANRNVIKDPDKIYPGQKITLPAA